MNSIFSSFFDEEGVVDSDRDRLKILKLFISQQKQICSPLQNNNNKLVPSEFRIGCSNAMHNFKFYQMDYISSKNLI